VSMMPPSGGSRPGAPPPPSPGGTPAPFEDEMRRRQEAEAAAARARADKAARSARLAGFMLLLLGLVVVAAAYWWLTPHGDSKPVASWERRVPQGVRIIGPSIGVSPNGKWFALAWAEGSRVWWLRGSAEMSGRLRLDIPQVVSDTTRPFTAFDEDPPKAAIDNAGQVAVAWMARPIGRDVGAVIAVARPDLEHDGGLAVTSIESPDSASFLLC